MDLATKSRTSTSPSVAPASGREHLLTVLFGLWMTVGLFLDGYFHQNLVADGESFLTPWHGVFYAGFGASALWLVVVARRRVPEGADWSFRFLPHGYGVAGLGIGLFALGGAGDAAWHSAFGVERGVDALLSPTHLFLFVGLLLILTAPLRAAAVGLGAGLWMLVASLTSATALVGFFLNFAWGLGISSLARVAYDPITEAGETQVIAGVASMLVTTVVLFGAARVLGRYGNPPVGGCAVLFGVVTTLVSVAFDEDIEGVAAAVVAGVVLDVVLRVLRARPPQPWATGLAFGGVAAGMWILYFGLLSGLDGIAWQREVWLGGSVLCAFAAYAIPAATPTAEVRA
jgi:hypothetical protein